MKIKINKL